MSGDERSRPRTIRFACAATAEYETKARQFLKSLSDSYLGTPVHYGTMATTVVRYGHPILAASPVLPPRVRWMVATLLKPIAAWCQFFLCGDPVVLLDADMECASGSSGVEVMKYLSGAFDDGYDAVVHGFPERVADGMKPGLCVSAGFVAFSSSYRGMSLFSAWALRCFERLALMCAAEPHDWPSPGDFPEQVALYETVSRSGRSGAKVANLPLRFNARPRDRSDPSAPWDLLPPGEAAVLYHRPASRSLKS